jgi:hypothetical protein
LTNKGAKGALLKHYEKIGVLQFGLQLQGPFANQHENMVLIVSNELH